MKTKPLLIETIKIQNGRVRNIKYHNRRCNISRKAIFGCTDEIDLRQMIDTSQIKSPTIKCRITYDEKVHKVEYESYIIRPIHCLKLIEIGNFEYAFKYANRTKLKEIYALRGDKDDVLMTKKGFITDTFYANVALAKKEIWYTPKNPLLKGSQRARLLEKGLLIEAEINIDQINEYDTLSIFNAMIPLKKITIDLCHNLKLIE